MKRGVEARVVQGTGNEAGKLNNTSDLMSSVELVYQRTRRDIVSGELAPGSALRLHELAARNGVSMIPVREALRLLEAEGFVDILQNKGARVAPLSLDDMIDVYRTRIVLETEALRQSMPLVTPQILAKARDLNAKLGRQKERTGFVVYEDHRAFHFTLYKPSGSRWLLRLIASVWDHTERYRRHVATRVTSASTVEEHERILSNVERGDTEGAVQALQDHLEGSVGVLTAVFQELTGGQAADGAKPAITASKRRLVQHVDSA
ncbi:GntR family transcriptional regulator [soil metagenome]